MLIHGIFIVNSYGLGIYSRVYNEIQIESLNLMSYLSAIQLYAGATLDSKINSIDFDNFHIIYRILAGDINNGIIAIIIVDEIDPLLIQKANEIINVLNSEFKILAQPLNAGCIFYSEEFIKKIDANIDNMIEDFNIKVKSSVNKVTIIELEKRLNKLIKKIPVKFLLVDKRVSFENNAIKLSYEIPEDDVEIIAEKVKTNVIKLFGSKAYEQILAEEKEKS